MTRDLSLVVTNAAEGAPRGLFPLAVAPIAPEPLLPVSSTSAKLTTVIEEATAWERVAVTATPVKRVAEKARQISAVPSCTLVLRTSSQLSAPPLMRVTVVFGVPTESADTNASNSCSSLFVENAAVVTVVDATD
jgi:hypothetical protein